MFIVLLRFSDNQSEAPKHMQGHNEWLQQGFTDGVFLLAGSLGQAQGGCILVNDDSLKAVEQRVSLDPFVAENVVTPEILELEPKKADQRLEFLLS